MGCVVGAAFSLIVIGAAFAVFFIFSGIKDSDANRLAVSALKQNPIAIENLGEITKVGWPVGNISVKGGGSGNSSFSMNVTGTKGKGKYFATLLRVNGQWRLISSRLQMEDGRSIELGPGAPQNSRDLSPP